MNTILFQHQDGTIYLSIDDKLIQVYPHTPKQVLTQIGRKLPPSQKKRLVRMRLAQQYLQQLLLGSVQEK